MTIKAQLKAIDSDLADAYPQIRQGLERIASNPEQAVLTVLEAADQSEAGKRHAKNKIAQLVDALKKQTKRLMAGTAAATAILVAYAVWPTKEEPKYTRTYQGQNYYIDAQIEYQGKQSWVAEEDVHPGAKVTAYRAVIVENGRPTPAAYIEKSALNAAKQALQELETKDVRNGRLGFMSYQPEHIKTALRLMPRQNDDGSIDTITLEDAKKAQKATGIDGL